MTTKAACAAVALAAFPFAARVAEEPALDGPALDAPAFARLEAQPDLARRGYSPRYVPAYGPRYQPEARRGPLVSFGLGGGSLYLSNTGPERFVAGDVDFRVGYGFSDQFQMFMDFNADGGTNYNGDTAGSWTWTLRGQTLLIGDRAGNGLNVNFGAGLGGLTYNPDYAGRSAGPIGFALAGGLSYDARLTPWFAISPEFFVTWHQVPNLPGIPDDVASIYGIRINMLWYLH